MLKLVHSREHWSLFLTKSVFDSLSSCSSIASRDFSQMLFLKCHTFSLLLLVTETEIMLFWVSEIKCHWSLSQKKLCLRLVFQWHNLYYFLLQGTFNSLALRLNRRWLHPMLLSLVLEVLGVMLHRCSWGLELAGSSLWTLTRYFVYDACVLSYLMLLVWTSFFVGWSYLY